jgi:hypothetical protein
MADWIYRNFAGIIVAAVLTVIVVANLGTLAYESNRSASKTAKTVVVVNEDSMVPNGDSSQFNLVIPKECISAHDDGSLTVRCMFNQGRWQLAPDHRVPVVSE